MFSVRRAFCFTGAPARYSPLCPVISNLHAAPLGSLFQIAFLPMVTHNLWIALLVDSAMTSPLTLLTAALPSDERQAPSYTCSVAVPISGAHSCHSLPLSSFFSFSFALYAYPVLSLFNTYLLPLLLSLNRSRKRATRLHTQRSVPLTLRQSGCANAALPRVRMAAPAKTTRATAFSSSLIPAPCAWRPCTTPAPTRYVQGRAGAGAVGIWNEAGGSAHSHEVAMHKKRTILMPLGPRLSSPPPTVSPVGCLSHNAWRLLGLLP